LLNTSKLDFWFDKPYSTEVTEKAIRHFTEAVSFLYTDSNNPVQRQKTTNNQTEPSNFPYNSVENRVLRSFLKSRAYETLADSQRISNLEKINREKEIFIDTIRESTNIRKSTKAFWSENSHRFRILSEVARKIFSIPASSAYIERFFSICGIVSSKISQNIKPENFINKVILRVNVDLLKA
jgi:hypothetical protein